MVTRVPPATGPYNGLTLSTEISLSVTANLQQKDVYSKRAVKLLCLFKNRASVTLLSNANVGITQ